MRVFTFRLGVLLGGLAGYVLGARAGRQRYEQIASAARSATSSRPVQQLGSEVKDMRDRAGDAIGAKAAEGVSRVTGKVRSALPGKAGNNGAPQEPEHP